MIKKVCIGLAAIVGTLSLAGPGFTQGTPERPGELLKPPAPIERPATNPETPGLSKQTTGEVLAANPAAKILIVVTTDWKQMGFLVADDAAVDLVQVQRGDRVTVHYTEEAGKFIARAISR